MIKYRKDLDFLRGLAVFSVVCFHLKIPYFQNGFIGVDIFFVLSGFLITTIALKEMSVNEFSIKKFTEKRMRRILPALVLLMLLNIPLTFFFFSPNDIENVAKSYISILPFQSNAFFWRQSGYFDRESEFQLLLHTWSISIEMQFYFAIGLILYLFERRGRSVNLHRTIRTLFFLSLTFSITTSIWKPGVAFYLFPSRAWEMLSGSLLAFQLNKQVRDKRILRFSTEIKYLGAFLVIGSLFFPTSIASWPSLLTIFPVFGTCLVIYAQHIGRFGKLFFENKIMVGLGKVSYGWFLWHWPVIVYLNYFSDLQISIWLVSLSAFVTLGFATIQWFAFEKSFLNESRISSRKFWNINLTAIMLIIFISVSIIATGGFQQLWTNVRLSAENRDIAKRYLVAENDEGEIRTKDSECIFEFYTEPDSKSKLFQYCSDKYGPATMIIGDSHGVVLYDVIARSGTGKFVVNWSRPTSRPSSGISGQYQDVLNFAKLNKKRILKVVFHQSGSYLVEDRFGQVDSSDSFRLGAREVQLAKSHLHKTINYLESLAKFVDVVWLGPYTESRINVQNPANWHESKRISLHIVEKFAELDSSLAQEVSKSKKVVYQSTQDHFKTPGNLILVDECVAWFNQDHWSECGRELLAKSASNFLRELISPDESVSEKSHGD